MATRTAAAAPPDSEMNEALTVGAVEGPCSEQQKTDSASYCEDEAKRKRQATLQAHLALRGFELVQLADCTFIVCKWGLASKPLADLEAAEAYARMVGAHV